MRLIFLGPPGIGKGTQARRLSQRYGWPHIATGDILRQAIHNNTPLGAKANRFVARGELVPDDIMIDIVQQHLKAQDCQRGFILDGFPRTTAQAQALQKLTCVPIDRVLYFTAPDQVIIERISGRRVCNRCGANFHIRYMPPKHPNTCDICSGELIHRADDHESAVAERLTAYNRQTTPLVAYYRGLGLLVEILALATPDQIFQDILQTLGLSPKRE